jgi:predicted ABC-type transport system involved in lysophospholipase L1 biosynthesis ATPase subunit
MRVAELLFSACRETGATLLLVTHHTALAARCPEVMNLSAGRVSYAAPARLAAAS